MSDSETALAVAAAIAALRDDEEEEMATDSGAGATTNIENGIGEASTEGSEGGVVYAKKSEPMEEEETAPPPPPKPPKKKVLSCLICTQPVTPDNTGMGSSNPREEYESMMRVVCKLLCVDTHPMLKRYQFRHSEEPKKLCCDDCCEVVFNLGSLQSIIDRTRLAINKKLDWILKTVADTAEEESEEIEKTFFSPKSDAFRSEVLQVYQRKKNSKNGLVESDEEEEEEMINRGVQTDISGESGVADVTTKAGLKSYERPTFSFDDSNNMDTYSDHNDDMPYTSSYNNDNDDSYSVGSSSNKKKPAPVKKQPPPLPVTTSYSSSYSKSPASTNKRGRSSAGNKRPSYKLEDSDDDDIEVLEEKKVPKGRVRGAAKSPKVDPRELLKVDYSSETGRPKRSTAAKRPNYQALAGDDDDYVPSYKRSSTGAAADTARNKKPTLRKEVSLSAIPIVKDASGKTYFEGVEIVRTEKSITCKHLGCYYVVDGSGYNAFERIKSHIHETHIGEGALPDIY